MIVININLKQKYYLIFILKNIVYINNLFYICIIKITNTMNTNQVEWIIEGAYMEVTPIQVNPKTETNFETQERTTFTLAEFRATQSSELSLKQMFVFFLRKAKLILQMFLYHFHRLTFGMLCGTSISPSMTGVVAAVALGVIVKFGVLDTTRGSKGIFPFQSSSSKGSSLFGLAPAAPSMLNEADVKRYVADYQAIAIDEMHQFGIPASVSMAQGLIESRCGESTLSVKNNNHFGLKCFSHNCKKGHCSNFTDDSHKDFFKKFGTATESWRAHSQLLAQGRYKSLHDLNKDNYEAWARGLQQLGYATDTEYATKLITIIEQYDLAELDNE